MASQTKRILVVDDASLVRLYYRRILEAAGYVVEEALNGVEGLEKVLANPPDMLIVDINMPQMDGIAFITALRRQEVPISGIPALVTSTEAGSHDMEAARAAGANYYLVKPLSENVLIDHAGLLSGRLR
jgi:two-component system chemotaxis response regulator CheY